jgi:hypothetical protein
MDWLLGLLGRSPKRRLAMLEEAGLTISPSQLRAATRRPVRLIRIDLGYGREVWAQFSPELRPLRATRTIEDGKVVLLDGDDPAQLAQQLGVPFDHVSVRF